jgi:hypothetical protein
LGPVSHALALGVTPTIPFKLLGLEANKRLQEATAQLRAHSPPTAQKMRKSQCAGRRRRRRKCAIFRRFSVLLGAEKAREGAHPRIFGAFFGGFMSFFGFPKKGGEAGTEITGCCRRGVWQACGPRLAAACWGGRHKIVCLSMFKKKYLYMCLLLLTKEVLAPLLHCAAR